MAKALVIVESPAKARTISKYLGSDFEVESSIGHVRDLPSGADEIPAKYKKEPWARLGVDIEKGFEPLYVVPKSKKAQIQKLKKALAKADALYLATDEDREGEAIAWHLHEVLAPKVPVKRMVFGEITKSAIQKAVDSTRDIDDQLVSAQEARRVLDRLYGYMISPVLWRKVRPKLSAGRVQSVATRLIVDRERERIQHTSAEYWDIEATLRNDSAQGESQTGTESSRSFVARLVEVSGQKVASGRDFDDDGRLVSEGTVALEESRAMTLVGGLEGQPFRVTEVKERPYTRRPQAPFITSTLQQEAAGKLRFTAQRTMRIAQGLYENGHITYMRTDSNQLSAEALEAARSQVATRYGSEYLPEETRVYTSRSKNAQEAHEAIRPTGSTFKAPEELSGSLDADALRLYDLIWKRTLASQMKDASGTTTTARIEASTEAGDVATFSASGRVIRFDGFLRVYADSSGTSTNGSGAAAEADGEAEGKDGDKLLPPLHENDALAAEHLEPIGHTTQPPSRFSEASLVKELEERGIGRPSTYASIIQTIQDRGYVWKKGSALVPTFTAFAVTRLLEQHLSALVDYDFTARMEDDLDAIARGEVESDPWLYEFYFGDQEVEDEPEPGLKDLIGSGWEEIDAREICSVTLGKNEDGETIAVRVGRYGAYLQAGDTDLRATIREDIPPEEMTLELAQQLLEKAAIGDLPLGEDPATGLPVYAKSGRFGDYVQIGEPELDSKGKIKTKPKMASVWPGMSKESISLEQALEILSFPKEIGVHPATNEVITAQDGRFGPYLKMGDDSRSLPDGHEQMRQITLEQAVELFAQPKQRGRRTAAPLKAFGDHPRTELPLVLKDGRFGPYVTDGTVNASVPKGRDPNTLELDDAVELIDAREQKLRDMGKDPRAKKAKKAKKKKKKTKKKAKKKAAKKTTKKKAKKKAAKKASKAKTAGEPKGQEVATEPETTPVAT